MPQTRTTDLKDVEDYVYDLGELIGFYSRLSEQAEADAIEKLWDPSRLTGREKYVFKCVRDGDGRLAALLRGWTDGARGIVYDIAVAREYRGKKAGKKLRDAVRAMRAQATRSNPSPAPIHWFGNPFRIASYLDRELAIVRTLYAISFVFGFQKLGEAVYFLGFQSHSHLKLTAPMCGLLFLLSVALSLLGFRFFWAVGNIRRCVLRRISQLRPPSRRSLLLYQAVLFCFPVIFFFLCRLFQDLCYSLSLSGFNYRFIIAFAAMLLVNVVWLYWLTEPETLGPELLWMSNNMIAALLVLLWLAAGYAFAVPNMVVIYVAAFMVLINDLVDLLGTSEAYILGDAFAGG